MSELVKIQPFSNGSQFMDWEAGNCDNCHKQGYYADPDNQNDWITRCDIQKALADAQWGADLTEEMGRRMGYILTDNATRSLEYGWRCTEFNPVISPAAYRRIFTPAPSRLAPLWKRLRDAWESAMGYWSPLWRPAVDIYGTPGRLSFKTAWDIGWILNRDTRVRCCECKATKPNA